MSDNDNPLEAQHKRLKGSDPAGMQERYKLLHSRLENIKDRDLVYLAMTVVEGCGCCAASEIGDPEWNRVAQELVDRLEAVV